MKELTKEQPRGRAFSSPKKRRGVTTSPYGEGGRKIFIERKQNIHIKTKKSPSLSNRANALNNFSSLNSRMGTGSKSYNK